MAVYNHIYLKNKTRVAEFKNYTRTSSNYVFDLSPVKKAQSLSNHNTIKAINEYCSLVTGDDFLSKIESSNNKHALLKTKIKIQKYKTSFIKYNSFIKGLNKNLSRVKQLFNELNGFYQKFLPIYNDIYQEKLESVLHLLSLQNIINSIDNDFEKIQEDIFNLPTHEILTIDNVRAVLKSTLKDISSRYFLVRNKIINKYEHLDCECVETNYQNDLASLTESADEVKSFNNKIEIYKSIETNISQKKQLATNLFIFKPELKREDAKSYLSINNEELNSYINEYLKKYSSIENLVRSGTQLINSNDFLSFAVEECLKETDDKSFVLACEKMFKIDSFTQKIVEFSDCYSKILDFLKANKKMFFEYFVKEHKYEKLHDFLSSESQYWFDYRYDGGNNVLHYLFSFTKDDSAKILYKWIPATYYQLLFLPNNSMNYPIDSLSSEETKKYISLKRSCRSYDPNYGKYNPGYDKKKEIAAKAVEEILKNTNDVAERYKFTIVLRNIRLGLVDSSALNNLYRSLVSDLVSRANKDFIPLFEKIDKASSYLICGNCVESLVDIYASFLGGFELEKLDKYLNCLNSFLQLSYCNNVVSYLNEKKPPLVEPGAPNYEGCINVLKSVAAITGTSLNNTTFSTLSSKIKKTALITAKKIYDLKPNKRLFNAISELDSSFKEAHFENEEFFLELGLGKNASNNDIKTAYYKKMIELKKAGASSEELSKMNKIYSELLRQ